MTSRIFAALAFTFLLGPAVVRAQGLADTAKREQERRKKAPATAPKKVYTESDLPNSGVKVAPPDAQPSPGGTPPGSTSSADADKAAADASARKEAEAWGAQIEAQKAEIAGLEAEVQRLGNHPTGGGKVCRLSQPIDFTKVAPEQVVCPAEMESMYDAAKRELAKAKTDLTLLEQQARSRGIVPRVQSRR